MDRSLSGGAVAVRAEPQRMIRPRILPHPRDALHGSVKEPMVSCTPRLFGALSFMCLFCARMLLPTTPAVGSMVCSWSTDGGLVAADLAFLPVIIGGEWQIQIIDNTNAFPSRRATSSSAYSTGSVIGSQRLHGNGVGLDCGIVEVCIFFRRV